jgi:hypothetical protein
VDVDVDRFAAVALGGCKASLGIGFAASRKAAQGSRFHLRRRSGTVRTVNAAGSRPGFISDQASGMATVAPGRERGQNEPIAVAPSPLRR